jgi:preprotein translocase subunit SecF
MVNVMKYRAITASFSVLLICAFIGYGLYRWSTTGEVFTYSVEFTGGTQVLFKFGKPAQQLAEATNNEEQKTEATSGSVDAARVKAILESKDWKGVVTRDFSSHEVLVRVKEFSNDIKGIAERLRADIQQEVGAISVSIEQTEAVGPGVGESLRWNSVLAVLYAMVAMLAYIAIRFWSFGFALGAVVALAHDALVMLAIFLFFGREISINVIGAILAILGYSVNDTIVIFSRIRDNMKHRGNHTMTYVVNHSINQTLTRTILTSLTTGLTVGSMFIFGGEALRDFSLALLIGIIFGTYSSIYVASPVMMLFHRD